MTAPAYQDSGESRAQSYGPASSGRARAALHAEKDGKSVTSKGQCVWDVREIGSSVTGAMTPPFQL